MSKQLDQKMVSHTQTQTHTQTHTHTHAQPALVLPTKLVGDDAASSNGAVMGMEQEDACRFLSWTRLQVAIHLATSPSPPCRDTYS